MIKKYYPFAILLIPIYFIVFAWMDIMPIITFDESRMAINAIEMIWNQNYLTPHFEGLPDMWQSKPPLLVWLELISIKLIGINEVGVRLPIALTSLLTCLVIYIFTINEFQKKTISIFSVLVLITSSGYINFHGARSGDYDILVTFFLFIQAISFYKFLKTEQNKYLFYFFIALTSGVLTKSIVSFFFIPGFFIYFLLEKKWKILLNYKIYLGLFLSCILFCSYYYLRDIQNPGYITHVLDFEVFGRATKALESHSHPYYFYLNQILNYRFFPWFFLFIIGFIFPLEDKNIIKWRNYFTILIISFVVLISFAQTKLVWYDTPIYPIISIVVGISLYYLYELRKNTHKKTTISILIILFSISYIPLQLNVYRHRENDCELADYKLAYFLRENSELVKSLKNPNIIWETYNAQNIFYCYQLIDKKIQVKIKQELKIGESCIFSEVNLKHKIEKDFSYVEIYNKDNVFIYKLLTKK